MIIAIDGPSGAGKSTVARLVSKNLNFEYVDTGAMYRALAYKVHTNNIAISEENMENMMLETRIDYIDNSIYLDNENIDDCIRSEHISKMASDISKLKSVRENMVRLQRMAAENKNVVMDGRDIGTVVFPDADYKFFVTASAEERAKRRFSELSEKGIPAVYEEVLQDIRKRDENDSTREISPLKIAENALVLDTTDMSIADVVNKILSVVGGTDAV